MKTTYKLTSSRLDGHFLISFEDERLKAFEINFKQPLSFQQLSHFLSRLPFSEAGISALEEIGLKADKVAAPNEKIALFCRIYEKHVGIKYKVSAADSGKIKQIQIDEAMLHHYFRSDNFLWKGKYSIANLTKYYNELRAEIAKGPASGHPDRWDKDYFTKLKTDQIPSYYAHLRGLGLTAKKNHVGAIVDWV